MVCVFRERTHPMFRTPCLAALLTVACAALHAQSGAPTGNSPAVAEIANGGDFFTAAMLMDRLPQVTERARASKDGLSSMTLKRYPGNYMALIVRARTTNAEIHANSSDVMLVLDGEADVITGGTLVDRVDAAGGESHGPSTQNGVHHVMHKGDLMHIAPNTAHWTVVPEGKTFAYLLVKVLNGDVPNHPPAPQAPQGH